MLICFKKITSSTNTPTAVNLAMFLGTFYKILFVTTIGTHKLLASPKDWKTVERLIEENPYIVALLNRTFDYICTGTIISKRTVLTSGICVMFNPQRVAVGTAVVSKNTSKRCLLEVAYTRLHVDYDYEMKAVEPNLTRMHSNIGLVFVVRPILNQFIRVAEFGKHYASELKDKKLFAVGYGEISGTHVVVLQYQNYNQTPCASPRWYYCVCGVEESNHTSKTYENSFGNGAPVLLGDQVVGVTASTSGTLYQRGSKYNIFTVIAPYLPWIEKADANSTFNMRSLIESKAILNQGSGSGSGSGGGSVVVKLASVLMLINKMCN